MNENDFFTYFGDREKKASSFSGQWPLFDFGFLVEKYVPKH